MNENLQYWSPSLQKKWISWWSLRLDFPNISIPRYIDMPEIDVFQIHRVEEPEESEGMTLEWLPVPKLGEDGKYYQDYKLNPIEE